ncbi:MAG TPA: VOC family protein [Roseiflexaceae bacterium]|nr:VOC family protein [Roseiflexaceae bacterium]
MLTESPVVYLMVYVRDLVVSRAFYEGGLGFRAIEEDADSVKYDAGTTLICLNRAAGYGVPLPTERDRSVEITFLVRDLDAAVEDLAQRCVAMTPIERYEVGALADCYDPDGHWISLYQPSDEALGWSSGGKVRAALQQAPQRDGPFALDGAPLIYLFLFVRDINTTFAFYHETLGLHNIEGGPCSSDVSDNDHGVVKYEAGGLMIATHHVTAAVAAKRGLLPERMKSVVPVFAVPDVARVASELQTRGVPLSLRPRRSQIGVIARFEEPEGRSFYLYEPSAEALAWPSGSRLQQIIAAPQGVSGA